MAVPKILGVETEYAIVHRGTPDSNPIAASSTLINAYVAELARGGEPGGPGARVGWDFEDEHPGNDARGFAPEAAMPPEVETHLVNAVLTNGARFYVDHAHPELSTPECATAREVLTWDRAGDVIVQKAMAAAERSLPDGQFLVVYKNNSDGKGNSYGCHENYLMDRQVPFGRIVSHITPFFVTRQIFTGAGKVGTEASGASKSDIGFQLTQRADFFEEEVGLETTLKRPIVNTRDEPHADPQKYRRLHVIVGDANVSETSTYLKVGTTAIVLAMIDDDFLARDLSIVAPVAALRRVSHDLSLKRPLELSSGGTATPLEVQWEYLEQAQKYAESHGLEVVGEETGRDVLDRWEQVLTALEIDPMTLADQLDWVAKYRMLSAYAERHDLAWDDARLAAMDLQYHDMRPERSLAAKLNLQRITTDDEVTNAVSYPPTTTRAWFRGTCLRRWSANIVAANWDSIVFDVGTDPLRRIPMMEPTRGTAAMLASLMDECESPAQLIERLGQ